MIPSCCKRRFDKRMRPDMRVHSGTTRMQRQRGFTIIELLVVIAITSILFTIIFKPLIDGFNLTSRAGTLVESQTAARETDRGVTRLLSNAVFVFDHAHTPLNLRV